MSTVQEDIRNKLKHILDNETDENVLKQLSEHLSAYMLRLSKEANTYSHLRADFSEREVRKINKAFERSKNPENLVSHDEVMANRLEKILKLRKWNA